MLVGEPDQVLPVVGPRQVGHMGGARVGVTLGFVPGNGESYYIYQQSTFDHLSHIMCKF